jgi:hypothetical protein
MTSRSASFRVRLLVALVLAISSISTSGTAALANAINANAVTWHIDHTAKLITADLRITLTPSCTIAQRIASALQPAVFARCQVPQAAADAMRANIDAVWNNGNKYYCYDFRLNIDIKIDNSNGDADPTNRVRVQVEGGTPRSFVRTTNATRGAWDSNGMLEQRIAGNDGTGSSTWAYPPPHSYDTNLYAHEAGHVLGLSDHYEDYVGPDGRTRSRPRPGAPDDIMSHQSNSNVHRNTMRRMIERAGYNKRQLKCNYKLDHSGGPSHVTGLQCDPEGGLWTANGIYNFAGAVGDQTWTMTIDWGTKRGNFDYADFQTMEATAGMTVKTEGTATGTATLLIDEELYARIHLVEQAHTYRSTIPGLPVWGSDQNAPLISNDQVWEPIGKCPP